ncbi:FHA domain-containing protein [Nostoc sp.]|uniref:FHA domain-containing protein n=1 Tax=Nostoc sp. TaxID=1180 RepID=UPI0035932F25
MKVKVSYSPTLSEVNEVDLTTETTTRGEWVIGRSPDSDLILESPDISRIHAKFFVKGGNYYFCDLGSRNGSIFNGKQAEKDRQYALSDGDVIRIADYVLILEGVAAAYEQAETVFRIIDPSLFSRSRSPENVSPANVANPAPEVVNEVETPEINAASLEISEISAVASTQTDDVIPVVEVIVSENIIQPLEAVNEVPVAISDEVTDLDIPVAAEVNTDVEEVEVPEITESSEVYFAEVDDAMPTPASNAIPENIIDTPEEESVLLETTHDPVGDLEAEDTFVQQRDTQSAIIEVTYDEDAELEAALIAEVTFVQPRDIFNELPTQESAVPEATHDEVVNLDIVIVEKSSVDTDELFSDVTPEVSEVAEDALNQVPQDVSDKVVDLDTSLTTEDSANVEEVEPVEVVNSAAASEALTAPNDGVSQVFNNEYIDLNDTNAEEVTVDVDDISAQVGEISDSANIQSLETTESEAPEIISQPIEEISEAEVIKSDTIPEETNVSEPPQIIVERNIVLIAHESKKSELAEFVSQHQEFFSQSFTITWPSVSEALHQQAGITISQQTPAPTSGGYQTIASLVGAGEISAVIFLRDLLQPQPGQANEEALLRLCNINQVLLATNLPTAKAIVYYLKARGE